MNSTTGAPVVLFPRSVLHLLLGLSAMALLALSVIMPRVTTSVLYLLLGAFVLLDGVIAIAIAALRSGESSRRVSRLLRGVLGVAVAIFALQVPAEDVFGLARLVGVWALASGLLELAIAFGLLDGDGGRLLAVNGVFSLLFGIVLLVHPPAGITMLLLLIAGYGLVSGVMLFIRTSRVAS